MSGSRTKTGCYSCRIRRKKCDEARPYCLACSSRGIDCLGYDVKPAWMIGMRSWQDILESEEAKAIRNSAGRAYNLRRQRRAMEKTSQDTQTPSGESDQLRSRRPHNPTGVLEGRGLISTASQSMVRSTWSPSTAMDSIWWDSNMSSTNGSPTFDFRNVIHFVEVICPLQYGFASLHYHPDYQDHRWLINSLVEDEPLYYTARGLSICLESGRQDGNTSGFCNASADVRKMQVMAIRGLQLRVDDLATERQRSVTPPVGMVSRVLATVLQLLSLEVFNSLGGDWEIHLNAANTTLGLFQKPWLARVPGFPTTQPEVDPIRRILANPIGTDEGKFLAFFITAFAWVDIMAGASTGKGPSKATDFEYTSLLYERLIDPSRIMGCHSTIMAVICNINTLSAWKDVLRKEANLNWAEFHERASAIESSIDRCLRGVINSRAHPSMGSTNTDSEVVTAIYGYAARIYLRLVVSEDPTLRSEMREDIRHCLEKLEVLPTRLFIRVCWPFAVAGCMAEESDQERFRALVARVVAERQVLGFTWKALIVMEECWRLRRHHGGSWCWRTTMRHMGLRVLFV
ncbi:fungal-specific transcription factor domain-containing protein [Nemania sp. NC0429]|nr:fungal-specific transcription factor domain-containing protein [Nemania sp. NC0429]